MTTSPTRSVAVDVVGGGISGITAHIGARVIANAGAGEVLVSGTVKELVAGSGIQFADRGIRTLKGVAGGWHLYCAAGDPERPSQCMWMARVR